MRMFNSPVRQRRGSVTVLIAFMLPILILISVFAVSLNQIQLNRAELRVASDAASRAGARSLSITQSMAAAEAAAVDAASRNTVAGKPLTLELGANPGERDVQFGVYTRATDAAIADGNNPWVFTPYVEGDPLNAVRVVGRKTTGSDPLISAEFRMGPRVPFSGGQRGCR